MPQGEPADHEQAHPASGVGRDLATGPQLLVELGQGVLGDAESSVGHLDDDPTAGERRGHHHLRARRRVRQGVVDQLGQQVDHVGGGLTADALRGCGVQLHAAVVLHTRDGGLEDVGQGEVVLLGGPRRGTGQDDEALRVAAHPRGQVVQAEQALQALRVLLVALQRLDQAELLVDQRGVAAGERDEHVADLGPEVGLTGGQLDGLAVQVVHGAGELAGLLVRGDGDRLDLARVLAGADLGDGLGQPLVGHLERTGPHPADRADQQPRDQQRQDDRGEQGEADDDRVGPGEHLGVARGGRQAVLDVGQHVVDEGVVGVVRRADHLGVAAAGVDHALGVALADLEHARVGLAERDREPVDRGELDAELRVQLDGVGGDGLAVGDLDLLQRHRQATVQGLGEHQQPGVGAGLLVDDGADDLGDASLELTYLRDRGGEADVRHAVAHLLAQRDHVVDLAQLGRGEVGLVARLDELRPGVHDLLLGGVELGVVDALRAGDHGGVLGGGQVGDRRAEDGDLRGAGGVVVRELALGVHAQAAEDGREGDGDREDQRDLAAQGPLGEVPERGLLTGRVHRRVAVLGGLLLGPLGGPGAGDLVGDGGSGGAGRGEAVGRADLAADLGGRLLACLRGALLRALLGATHLVGVGRLRRRRVLGRRRGSLRRGRVGATLGEHLAPGG